MMDLTKSKTAWTSRTLRARLRVIRSEEEVVAELKSGGEDGGALLLATDPDRVGRGHRLACLRAAEADEDPGAADPLQEIPRSHPGSDPEAAQLNRDLYDAQRRAGCWTAWSGTRSPHPLERRSAARLSAARAGVAVRLVVEREERIAKFVPVEYGASRPTCGAALPPQFRSS